MKLELVDTIEIAHPFVKGFDKTYHCACGEEVNTVARGEIPEAVNKRKKEEIEGQEGGGTVYATSFFIGLEIQPKKGGFCALIVAIAFIFIQRVPLALGNSIYRIQRLSSRRWSRCGIIMMTTAWALLFDISRGLFMSSSILQDVFAHTLSTVLLYQIFFLRMTTDNQGRR